MKCQTVSTAVLLSVLAASVGMAECNRGGNNRTTESAGSQFTQNGIQSPFNSINGESIYQRGRRAMFAQQQAQQQMMVRQAMAQRQSQLASQVARRRSRSSANERLASTGSSTTARQDRLRQKNAEKVFALATKAEYNGRTSVAEKYYRRAIRIAGSNSSLSQRAEEAIAALSPRQSDTESDTLLASIAADIANGS